MVELSHKVDAVIAPALAARKFAREPAGERAEAGDGDLLALEIVDGLERAVGAHRHHDLDRRAGERRDRHDRRALDDHRHVGAAVETDVDGVRRHRLQQPRAAAER